MNQWFRCMIPVWEHIMNKRINPASVARTLLSNLDKHQPLNKREAERVRVALENCGVPEATTRLQAGLTRIVLKTVTE